MSFSKRYSSDPKPLNLGTYVKVWFIFIVLNALCWGFFHWKGPAFIESIYRGESFGVLNQMIRGQNVHDAAHYVQTAKHLLRNVSQKIILFLLGWGWLILCSGMFRLGIRYFIYCVVVTAVLMEGLLLFLLHNPRYIKVENLRVALQHYYMNYHRDTIHLNASCAAYDEKLGYALKPGKCRFSNLEFDTTYEINSAGLRDDEDSLEKPEIIVLGDSHSMGWAVEQGETYADILEKKLGKKVLNAAISSYGTPRELILLSRLDTSNLKYLVLQYHAGDFLENETYQKNGDVLPIMKRDEYLAAQEENKRVVSYFPGEVTFYLLKKMVFDLTKGLFPGDEAEFGAEKETRSFLHVLEYEFPEELRSVPLMVIQAGGGCHDIPAFLDALEESLSGGDYPNWMTKMKPVNVTRNLNPKEHCFVLEDHFNRAAHVKIAETLQTVLLKKKRDSPQWGQVKLKQKDIYIVDYFAQHTLQQQK